jgi:hypothetical protein
MQGYFPQSEIRLLAVNKGKSCMKITLKSLDRAVDSGLITQAQADQLWQFLAANTEDTSSFRLTQVLYYLGGCITLGALTFFMTESWSRFSGSGLLVISLIYAGIALALAEFFSRRWHLPIPAGIMASLVVVLTPLIVVGLQSTLGWTSVWQTYPSYYSQIFETRVDGRWLYSELASLAVAIAMLWRYRLPFLVMPMAMTLWFISIDFAPLLFGASIELGTGDLAISMGFGLLFLIIAFWTDLRTRHDRDFAFWLYLVGVFTFWSALWAEQVNHHVPCIVDLGINLLMILLGAVLARRVFTIFGGIGVAWRLGVLASTTFENSLLFSLALTLIGLAFIGLGILWQRYETALSTRLRRGLPVTVQELLAQRP